MSTTGYELRATGYSQKQEGCTELVLILAVACRLSPVAIVTAGAPR
jgi:hypothetical protein